jgi:hypothetical protein
VPDKQVLPVKGAITALPLARVARGLMAKLVAPKEGLVKLVFVIGARQSAASLAQAVGGSYLRCSALVNVW